MSAAARAAARADEAVAAHERHLERGEREADVDRRALRHVAEARRACRRETDGAAHRRQQAQHGAHQRGLAAAVRSDDADGVAGRDGEIRRAAARPRRGSRPRRRELDEVHALLARFDQRLEALHRLMHFVVEPGEDRAGDEARAEAGELFARGDAGQPGVIHARTNKSDRRGRRGAPPTQRTQLARLPAPRRRRSTGRRAGPAAKCSVEPTARAQLAVARALQHGKPARPRREIGENAPAVVGRRGHVDGVVHGRHRRALYRIADSVTILARPMAKKPKPAAPTRRRGRRWRAGRRRRSRRRRARREPDVAELGDEDVPADDALPPLDDDDEDDAGATRWCRRCVPAAPTAQPLAGAARSAAALHQRHPPLSAAVARGGARAGGEVRRRPATSRRRAGW